MRVVVVDRQGDRIKYQVLDDQGNELHSRTVDRDKFETDALERGIDVESVLFEYEAEKAGFNVEPLVSVSEWPDELAHHFHPVPEHRHDVPEHRHPLERHTHPDYEGSLKELPEHGHDLEKHDHPHSHTELPIVKQLEHDFSSLSADLHRQSRVWATTSQEDYTKLSDELRSVRNSIGNFGNEIEYLKSKPEPRIVDHTEELGKINGKLDELDRRIDSVISRLNGHKHDLPEHGHSHEHDYAKPSHSHAVTESSHTHHWHRSSVSKQDGKNMVIYRCIECNAREEHSS